MRLIDADNLSSRKLPAVGYEHVSGWYGNGWNDAIDTIMEEEPSVPLPDFKDGYKQAILDGKTNFSRPHGEWKVIGRNVPNNIWHVFCPKCNCDMFTEFTSYCPNCGEPKKEINIAELTFKEADDDN